MSATTELHGSLVANTPLEVDFSSSPSVQEIELNLINPPIPFATTPVVYYAYQSQAMDAGGASSAWPLIGLLLPIKITAPKSIDRLILQSNVAATYQIRITRDSNVRE